MLCWPWLKAAWTNWRMEFMVKCWIHAFYNRHCAKKSNEAFGKNWKNTQICVVPKATENQQLFWIQTFVWIRFRLHSVSFQTSNCVFIVVKKILSTWIKIKLLYLKFLKVIKIFQYRFVLHIQNCLSNPPVVPIFKVLFSFHGTMIILFWRYNCKTFYFPSLNTTKEEPSAQKVHFFHWLLAHSVLLSLVTLLLLYKGGIFAFFLSLGNLVDKKFWKLLTMMIFSHIQFYLPHKPLTEHLPSKTRPKACCW